MSEPQEAELSDLFPNFVDAEGVHIRIKMLASAQTNVTWVTEGKPEGLIFRGAE